MAKQADFVLSHWYQLFEGLQESPQQIYTSIEETFKKREVPNTSISRIDYREGGLLSAKREYLRVRRYQYVFDICVAHFGKGMFVSWWLGETISGLKALIVMIPFIGPLMARTFRPETYFRFDTALMFQESVRMAVLEVIDQMIQVKGLRALSELERKPIMSDLFKR